MEHAPYSYGKDATTLVLPQDILVSVTIPELCSITPCNSHNSARSGYPDPCQQMERRYRIIDVIFVFFVSLSIILVSLSISYDVPLSSNQLQSTLKTLQAYLSAVAGRPLKQSELAAIADMNPRSFGEWMRGATSPAGVQALLRLLSEVPPQALSQLLEPWKKDRLQTVSESFSVRQASKQRNADTKQRQGRKSKTAKGK